LAYYVAHTKKGHFYEEDDFHIIIHRKATSKDGDAEGYKGEGKSRK